MTADQLLAALRGAAARLYGGEAVSELEHALQCADLAHDGGADEELQLACLLHDVGRWAADPSLISDRTVVGASQDSVPRSRDSHRVIGGPAPVIAAGHGRATARVPVPHSTVGADIIATWAPVRVTWCVRMHADAKRYLCVTDPAYYDRLSPASRHTLRLQGGPMSTAEIAALSGHPWLADALNLRRWDDDAKVPGKATRTLAEWEALVHRYFAKRRVTSDT